MVDGRALVGGRNQKKKLFTVFFSTGVSMYAEYSIHVHITVCTCKESTYGL